MAAGACIPTEKKKHLTDLSAERPSVIPEPGKITPFIKPMLARQAAGPFDSRDWIFEIKWDGYRAITEKNKNKLLLYSRNGLNFRERYPIVYEQLKKVKENVVLDGEIVVLNEEGRPDFQLLQHYSEHPDRPIQYYIFDLLRQNGKDLTSLPLTERKKLLEGIIPANPVLKFSDHIEEKGKEFFRAAIKKKLEGIMAKRKDSGYEIGKRTGNWLKIKDHQTAEVIIVGYTAPRRSRKYFGALILAFREGNHYRYAGHTGTGFPAGLLKELYRLMQPLVQDHSPLAQKIKTNAPVTWLKPFLVCEIKYTEVTADGLFRHPVFLHLREDKSIKEINMKNFKEAAVTQKKAAGSPASPKTKGSGKSASAEKKYVFGKNKVIMSHPDKIYFPEKAITKEAVAEYYLSMADYILPYLKNRPESLFRMPDGIHGESFFQKDFTSDIPPFAGSKKIFSESAYKDIHYIICNNAATLVYLINLGCIELNPWHSTADKPDYPDYLVIDIDPSEKNTFEQVVETALTVKKILDKAGAPSYCKTSGATGMHVYVPTQKKYTYEQVKNFAHVVCSMVNEELKTLTTLERSLSKRSRKQLYLDYLQNRPGQTIAAVYCLRPRKDATVSTPLSWEEVEKGVSPQDFTIDNMLQRVQKTGDLFKGVLGKGINLEKCIDRLSSNR